MSAHYRQRIRADLAGRSRGGPDSGKLRAILAQLDALNPQGST